MGLIMAVTYATESPFGSRAQFSCIIRRLQVGGFYGDRSSTSDAFRPEAVISIGHCDTLVAPEVLSLFKNATMCSATSSGCSKTMLCPQLGMPASQVFGRLVATLKAFCGTATSSSKP